MNRLLLPLFLCFLPMFAWAVEPEFLAVASIPNGKTLLLEDGRTVRLAAIQAPNIARDAEEEDEPLAVAARDHLQRWVDAAGTVRLQPTSKERDRHGRVVALVFNAAGESAQEAQLAAGYGWTYTFPDTRELAENFMEAEREAEQNRRGVWGERAYAPLPNEQAEAHLGEFRLVEGTIQTVADTRRNRYLNFGADWKTDFTLTIEPENDKNFDPQWVTELEGKRVRVRGWLFNRNGAMINLTHPEQLEVIGENATTFIQ